MNYAKNMVIKLDKDWITDFTFDFSKGMTTITTHAVTAETGLTVVASAIDSANKVVVRLSGGTENTRYAVSVSATSDNGEKRDMTVIFLVI